MSVVNMFEGSNVSHKGAYKFVHYKYEAIKVIYKVKINMNRL